MLVISDLDAKMKVTISNILSCNSDLSNTMQEAGTTCIRRCQ